MKIQVVFNDFGGRGVFLFTVIANLQPLLLQESKADLSAFCGCLVVFFLSVVGVSL